MAAKRGRAISVLIVDDHRTFAEALAVAFGLEGDLTARVAASGAEAIAAARRRPPDVVLVDLEMPGMTGLETVKRIREVAPRARLIVLSGHDEDVHQARAYDAGAVGYVSKVTPVADVPELVRRVHRGEQLVDQQEAHRLRRVLRRRRHEEETERQRVGRLTPRQIEILELTAEGMAARDIAAKLNLSFHTVRTHQHNILQRLSVHSRAEAIALVVRHGKLRPR